jgi:uncharacterized protein (DUF2147 family)
MTPKLLALTCVLAASGAEAAESRPAEAGANNAVYGVWRAPQRDAQVEVAPCEGGAVCGKLLSASRPKSNPELLDIHNKDPAKRHRSMIGQTIFHGFKGGPTKWTGGRLYNPGDGKHYKGTMTLVDHNHLKLKGCAVAFLCKSETLTRAG